MRVPREPRDAARLVKDWLKTELAQPFPTLQVRLTLPEDWELGHPPVLVVFDDGGAISHWPVATDPTIRLTSWTSGRDIAIINRALGLLLTARVPGFAKILPGTAVIESRDTKNRGDLASVTVRTRLRTQSF